MTSTYCPIYETFRKQPDFDNSNPHPAASQEARLLELKTFTSSQDSPLFSTDLDIMRGAVRGNAKTEDTATSRASAEHSLMSDQLPRVPVPHQESESMLRQPRPQRLESETVSHASESEIVSLKSDPTSGATPTPDWTEYTWEEPPPTLHQILDEEETPSCTLYNQPKSYWGQLEESCGLLRGGGTAEVLMDVEPTPNATHSQTFSPIPTFHTLLRSKTPQTVFPVEMTESDCGGSAPKRPLGEWDTARLARPRTLAGGLEDLNSENKVPKGHYNSARYSYCSSGSSFDLARLRFPSSSLGSEECPPPRPPAPVPKASHQVARRSYSGSSRSSSSSRHSSAKSSPSPTSSSSSRSRSGSSDCASPRRTLATALEHYTSASPKARGFVPKRYYYSTSASSSPGSSSSHPYDSDSDPDSWVTAGSIRSPGSVSRPTTPAIRIVLTDVEDNTRTLSHPETNSGSDSDCDSSNSSSMCVGSHRDSQPQPQEHQSTATTVNEETTTSPTRPEANSISDSDSDSSGSSNSSNICVLSHSNSQSEEHQSTGTTVNEETITSPTGSGVNSISDSDSDSSGSSNSSNICVLSHSNSQSEEHQSTGTTVNEVTTPSPTDSEVASISDSDSDCDSNNSSNSSNSSTTCVESHSDYPPQGPPYFVPRVPPETTIPPTSPTNFQSQKFSPTQSYHPLSPSPLSRGFIPPSESSSDSGHQTSLPILAPHNDLHALRSLDSIETLRGSSCPSDILSFGSSYSDSRGSSLETLESLLTSESSCSSNILLTSESSCSSNIPPSESSDSDSQDSLPSLETLESLLNSGNVYPSDIPPSKPSDSVFDKPLPILPCHKDLPPLPPLDSQETLPSTESVRPNHIHSETHPIIKPQPAVKKAGRFSFVCKAAKKLQLS